MCSIVEDDFGDDGGVHAMTEEQSPNATIITSEICKSCNKNPTVVQLKFKEPQCKECFLFYVRHKFRASLGASKIVRRGSNVLIEFNGSPNSLALMDMVNYGISQEVFRKLNFNVFTVFIDESFTNGRTMTSRLNRLHSAVDVLSRFKFESNFYTSLAMGKTTEYVPIMADVDFTTFHESEAKFLAEFSAIKTQTLKQDFLRMTRKNVLRAIANSLSCQSIFTSEICPELASLVLTDVALGRGCSTALNVAFVDDRQDDAKIVRPIRDLSQMELNKYLELNEIQTMEFENFGSDKGDFSSIQNLTWSFVAGLQKNYPSTVSTVFRTGDKMASLPVVEEARCSFCKGSIDCSDSETLHAIEFSSQMSKVGAQKTAISNRMEKLCHGCRNIFNGFD